MSSWFQRGESGLPHVPAHLAHLEVVRTEFGGFSPDSDTGRIALMELFEQIGDSPFGSELRRQIGQAATTPVGAAHEVDLVLAEVERSLVDDTINGVEGLLRQDDTE
jgi:hypothetical protein